MRQVADTLRGGAKPSHLGFILEGLPNPQEKAGENPDVLAQDVLASSSSSMPQPQHVSQVSTSSHNPGEVTAVAIIFCRERTWMFHLVHRSHVPSLCLTLDDQKLVLATCSTPARTTEGPLPEYGAKEFPSR